MRISRVRRKVKQVDVETATLGVVFRLYHMATPRQLELLDPDDRALFEGYVNWIRVRAGTAECFPTAVCDLEIVDRAPVRTVTVTETWYVRTRRTFFGLTFR